MPYTYAGHFQEALLTQRGKPMDDATVHVYTDEAATIEATLYTDRTKATPASNPTVAEDGNLEFRADPGLYWITVTYQGDTSDPYDITVPIDPSEPGSTENPTFYVERYQTGGVSEREAIQAAIDAANTAGGGVVEGDPSVTYTIERPIFMKTGVSLRHVKMTRAQSVKSNITANVADNATTVTVANGALFTEGYGIHLQDDNGDTWNYPQDAYITDITGNVITLSEPTSVAIPTSNNPYAVQAFPLIRNEQDASDFEVAYCTLDQNRLDGTDPDTGDQAFLLSAISYIGAYDAHTHHNKIVNAVGDFYSDQSNNGRDVALSAAAVERTNNHFTHNVCDDSGLYGVHLGTCMDGALVAHNTIKNCLQSGVHYSAFVTRTQVRGNMIVDPGTHGIGELDDRDTDNIIEGNTIISPTNWGIATEAGAASAPVANQSPTIIKGNVITDPPSGGIAVSSSMMTVEGNTIRMGTTGNQAIKLTSGADRCAVSNNIVEGGGAGSVGILLDGPEDVRCAGNIIKGVANGFDLRAALRPVFVNNFVSVTNQAVQFNTTTSTDARFWSNEITGSFVENVAATRLAINGYGTNGTADPASGGDWNTVSGTRYNGIKVKWTDSGAERISDFYNGRGWKRIDTSTHDVRGSLHADALRPTVALAETFSRIGSTYGNASAIASGRMHLCAIYIPTGTLVTSISFISGGTALSAGTHQWFALYDSARALLRQTTNDTSTAWAANTIKTLNLTSTFTTTYSGLHYIGINVTATTVPSLTCISSSSGAEKAWGLTPIVSGSSDSGLTGTAPASAGISANVSVYPYAYVS